MKRAVLCMSSAHTDFCFFDGAAIDERKQSPLRAGCLPSTHGSTGTFQEENSEVSHFQGLWRGSKRRQGKGYDCYVSCNWQKRERVVATTKSGPARPVQESPL